MSGQEYKIGKWVFSPATNELSRAADVRRLENRAAKALLYFCNHPGEVISREALFEHIWEGRTVSEQSLAVVINGLRRALDDPSDAPHFIETVPKKGYRLTVAVPVGAVSARRWGLIAAVAAVIGAIALFAVYEMRPAPAPEGIIAVVTINDIRNGTGDEGRQSLALALSELGASYLSQAEDILLIRHWWNLDAENPTGGILERYGDAPVYNITGTLVDLDGNISVTVFVNDPATDEVISSARYPLSGGGFAASHLTALSAALGDAGVARDPVLNRFASAEGVGDENYLLGQYFWGLGTEGGARMANQFWTQALEENPDLELAEAGLRAVEARWGEAPERSIGSLDSSDPGDYRSLLLAASIAFYGDNDPAKAEALVRQALDLAPNSASALSLLAEALVMQGDRDGAIEAMTRAQSMDPFSEVFRQRLDQFSTTGGGSD